MFDITGLLTFLLTCVLCALAWFLSARAQRKADRRAMPALDVARESIWFQTPDGARAFVVTDITYNVNGGRGGPCYVSLQDRQSWEDEHRLPPRWAR